jgi:serine protease Do
MIPAGRCLPMLFLAASLATVSSAAFGLPMQEQTESALDSLVRVQVRQKFSGIRYEDRLITQSAVVEVNESPGVVLDSRGLVVSYIGSTWTKLVGERSLFSVVLPDGRQLNADLLGIDERVSLAVLKVDELKGRAIVLGALEGGRQGVLHAWGKSRWEQYSLDISEAAESDVKFEREVRARIGRAGQAECCPEGFPAEGSLLLDKSNRFLGFVTQADRAGLSPQQRSLRVLSVQAARDSVKRILDRGGSVRAGWLGIFMRTDTNRVVVDNLVDNSPAQRVGLRPGDLILKFNGHNIWSRNQFVKLVRWSEPGSQVTLSVERDGRFVNLQPVLGDSTESEQPVFVWAMEFPPVVDSGERPAETSRVRFYPVLAGPKAHLGLGLHPLTPQLAEFFDVPRDGGLLVESILPRSPAQKLGFQVGDVLIEINGIPLRSVADLTRIADADAAGGLEVVFVREGKIWSRRVVLQ